MNNLNIVNIQDVQKIFDEGLFNYNTCKQTGMIEIDITLGDNNYSGTLYIINNKLDRIELEPVLSAIQQPTYPSKEYIIAKYTYNIEVVTTLFGDVAKHNKNTDIWEVDNFLIICSGVFNRTWDNLDGGTIIIRHKYA